MNELRTDDELRRHWLAGTGAGVWAVADDHAGCVRLGAYQFSIPNLSRTTQRVLAATGSGLWEVRAGMWRQHHDESLTEVMDVLDEPAGLTAASAYGVATSRTDESGATRWDWCCDGLPVNRRFTNALARRDDGALIAGTEGGVQLRLDEQWQLSNLTEPVRCLRRDGDGWLAGTDTGLFASDDAETWNPAGIDDAVFDLCVVGNLVLAGTEQGLRVRRGASWADGGLQEMRVGAVQVGDDDTDWVAGGFPGGLWRSRDAGRRWSRVPGLPTTVWSILAPEISS